MKKRALKNASYPVTMTSSMSWTEIKRPLLLGKEAMTNLDRILKSRDITLLTKVQIVKAMVFTIVMYECEGWTIILWLSTKELMLLNCGAGEDSSESLEQQSQS